MDAVNGWSPGLPLGSGAPGRLRYQARCYRSRLTADGLAEWWACPHKHRRKGAAEVCAYKAARRLNSSKPPKPQGR